MSYEDEVETLIALGFDPDYARQSALRYGGFGA